MIVEDQRKSSTLNVKLGDIIDTDQGLRLICYTSELQHFSVILTSEEKGYIGKVSKKGYPLIEGLLKSYKKHELITKVNCKLIITD